MLGAMDPANFNLASLFTEKISEAETLLLRAEGARFLQTSASFAAVAAGQSAATLIGHLARVPDCDPGG
jgi:hypothetical protein